MNDESEHAHDHHEHAHDQDQGHGGHGHGHAHHDLTKGITGGLIIGIALNLVIVFVELIASFAAGSLSLLSDAMHNFTDMAALGIAWFAISQAKKPPTAARTFGYHRTGILTALINAMALVLVTLWIFYEAYRRLLEPQPVAGSLVMGTAAIALLANLSIVFFLRGRAGHDINIRSAILHLIGDAAASAAVLFSGVIILLTGWYPIDPLTSIALGLAILWGAWGIIKETMEIFLEQAPRAIDTDKVVAKLMEEDGVKDVHDIHIWTIGSGIYALSCHILVEDVKVSESNRILCDLKKILDCSFGIDHSTIEVEAVRCPITGPFCDIHR